MKLNKPKDIQNCLMQIYGELNRIRLILGEKSERGQKIEKFDRETNAYIPFFDNDEEFKKFPYPKGLKIK